MKDSPTSLNKDDKKLSSETVRTTDSMRRRANVFARCLISLMKIFRMCKHPMAEEKHKKSYLCFLLLGVFSVLLLLPRDFLGQFNFESRPSYGGLLHRVSMWDQSLVLSPLGHLLARLSNVLEPINSHVFGNHIYYLAL